jgi:7-cyano-7-deazaguanine synthase
MKTVLVYSGGLDSTVLLYHLLSEGDEVLALTFDYGQRHRREVNSAAYICCLDRGVEWKLADITSLRPLLSKGAQTDHSLPVPEGHYSEEGMKATVSPARNLIMLSIATGVAVAQGYNRVAYAAHAGDHAIYPDCRPGFVEAMGYVMAEGTYEEIDLWAPFTWKAKADIVKLGVELAVPFHLTWSCYAGRDLPCGRCGTCVERLEAFDLTHTTDPLTYEDREFWRTAVEAKK